ncbi:GON domain-containing protein [Caenorhabditis elegans]|uniref:GON domain-containing protein n=1 Tax=Caenorhabditis elegans TaxID=6239 RepID=Q9XUD9_CAEEL|nr:GON domain-containing protein [Caenorhabditis elegans]CAB05217.2 GON domain-containing protein [Caenorhabditis elegans]|eukprot:NP_502477.2 Uncharacterized protein CELE_F55G11.10 [Caenorhabditis elegans]
MVANDFYLMIFRSGAPPIFNHRFLKKEEKLVKIKPKGISCVKVNGVYEWQFYGGKVNDMSFAMQQNECGGPQPNYSGAGGTTVAMPKAFGACDIYKPTCLLKKIPSFLTTILLMGVPQSASMIYSDFTYVSGRWYYNNVPLPSFYNNPVVQCNAEETKLTATSRVTGFKHSYYCGCRGMEKVPPTQAASVLMNFYEATPYYNLKYRDEIISYDVSTCTAKMSCTGNDSLILFSGSLKPVKFLPGESPSISCHPATSRPYPDNSYLTKKQWYIDGIMMNAPVFSCQQNNGCACKYVPLTSGNIQKLVGLSSFFHSLILVQSKRQPMTEKEQFAQQLSDVLKIMFLSVLT